MMEHWCSAHNSGSYKGCVLKHQLLLCSWMKVASKDEFFFSDLEAGLRVVLTNLEEGLQTYIYMYKMGSKGGKWGK